MSMSKEDLKNHYLWRTEAYEFSFKIELAVGTFEAYGHWSDDGAIDYDFFINQELVDGGRYKNDLWKDCNDFEWDLLIYETLEYYYGGK